MPSQSKVFDRHSRPPGDAGDLVLGHENRRHGFGVGGEQELAVGPEPGERVVQRLRERRVQVGLDLVDEHHGVADLLADELVKDGEHRLLADKLSARSYVTRPSRLRMK